MSAQLTLFSFGYWGWGTATPQLVKAVDAVEASRGFAPPLFVDVRIRRSVRAPGFNNDAFVRTVGSERYVWMQDLGNEAVLRDTGERITIRKPAAARDLLDLAQAAAKNSRRVIFFCSCLHPHQEGDPDSCHRTTIAGLVLKAARKLQSPVNVVEWPGGEPVVIERSVPPEIWRKLKARVGSEVGLKNIPIGKQLPDPQWLGLPHGSVLEIEHGPERLAAVSGPATYAADHWQLPVLSVYDLSSHSGRQVLAKASAIRGEFGWNARSK